MDQERPPETLPKTQREVNLILINEVLSSEDRERVHDRDGRLRISERELEYPIRFGSLQGKLCLILGPLASQCENCKSNSRTIPGMEPKNQMQADIMEAMDIGFVGMRHPQRCERRILLSADTDYQTQEERHAKINKILREVANGERL